MKFCQLFPEEVLTEQWMLLWRRAIIRSLVSHVVCNRHLSNHVSLEARKRLVSDFTEVLRSYTAHVSVYSQVSEIINEFHSRNSIEKYLSRPVWAEVETIIADVLAGCPPICFYLDAVDEEFAHAPTYWLRCQKGLFYQAMRFLRDSQLGSRLHLVISVRDTVLSSVYRSEHQTRYRGEPHIRVLSWNKASIGHFLRAKLAQLDNKFFLGTMENGKTISAWLGFSDIANEERGITEPLIQYVLRHTRLLPRDIVILGSHLCRAISNLPPGSTEAERQKMVRRCIAEQAKVFGDEQLAICANELAANSMPARAVQHGYSETYTGNKEYARGLVDELKALISFLGVDRFGPKKLAEAREFAKERFPEQCDPFAVLWINGLVGFVDGGKAERHVFYSEDRMDDFLFPLDRHTYVLHPILIDSVQIRAVGKRPVIPFDGDVSGTAA